MALSLLIASITLAFATPASAGPAAYGLCQAGCSAVVMACYSAAGFTWGATLGASAPASIIACNTAFGRYSKFMYDTDKTKAIHKLHGQEKAGVNEYIL
ncbi:hypothetical protein GMOD_00005407 [Pyrenophora seminiperda CCB06]|uniref:Uncharacterized protein n=1 Tax=Pyrenophora seminiperda CCB06 TaxID=1302712 RepID=A0A3M7LVR6_9PLEO|nr:hypothetical protein GMOD_00005407 [Pyrenophora seminiperda CCB06]